MRRPSCAAFSAPDTLTPFEKRQGTQQTAIIYDFATRRPVSDTNVANFDIVQWNDTEIRWMAQNGDRVLVDGLVPVSVALEMKAVADRYNSELSRAHH